MLQESSKAGQANKKNSNSKIKERTIYLSKSKEDLNVVSLSGTSKMYVLIIKSL